MRLDDPIKVYSTQKSPKQAIERRLLDDDTIIWLVPTISEKNRVSPWVSAQVFTFSDIQSYSQEYLHRKPTPKVAIVHIEHISKIRLCKLMYAIAKRGLVVDIYD